MTHTHAKGQGQRSGGLKDKMETDGRTEAIALPLMLTRSATVETDAIRIYIYVAAVLTHKKQPN